MDHLLKVWYLSVSHDMSIIMIYIEKAGKYFSVLCSVIHVFFVKQTGTYLGSYVAPDSKVHGANMGPTWALSAPDGPHVGAMNIPIRGTL